MVEETSTMANLYLTGNVHETVWDTARFHQAAENIEALTPDQCNNHFFERRYQVACELRVAAGMPTSRINQGLLVAAQMLVCVLI